MARSRIEPLVTDGMVFLDLVVVSLCCPSAPRAHLSREKAGTISLQTPRNRHSRPPLPPVLVIFAHFSLEGQQCDERHTYSSAVNSMCGCGVGGDSCAHGKFFFFAEKQTQIRGVGAPQLLLLVRTLDLMQPFVTSGPRP